MFEIANAMFMLTNNPAIPDKPNKVLTINANRMFKTGPTKAILAVSASEGRKYFLPSLCAAVTPIAKVPTAKK